MVLNILKPHFFFLYHHHLCLFGPSSFPFDLRNLTSVFQKPLAFTNIFLCKNPIVVFAILNCLTKHNSFKNLFSINGKFHFFFWLNTILFCGYMPLSYNLLLVTLRVFPFPAYCKYCCNKQDRAYSFLR